MVSRSAAIPLLHGGSEVTIQELTDMAAEDASTAISTEATARDAAIAAAIAAIPKTPILVLVTPQASATQKTLANVAMNIPITENCKIPANFAGSKGYARVATTSDAPFVASYIHSGSPTTIGNIDFAAAAQIPTFPTTAEIDLVAGDVLVITSPLSQDGTLGQVNFTIVLQRT